MIEKQSPENTKSHYLDKYFNALSTISAYWILLICLIYLIDIFGRELFNTPFLGTHEIVANSIVGILFIELPATIRRGAMLRTTMIFENVGDLGRRIIDGISYIFGVALFLSIVVGGWHATLDSWRIWEIEGAGAIEIPVFPVRTLIVIFGAICAAVYAVLLFHTIIDKDSGKLRAVKMSTSAD